MDKDQQEATKGSTPFFTPRKTMPPAPLPNVEKPDLSKVRLVDPQALEAKWPEKETTEPDREPEKSQFDAEQFWLEYNCDEGERKFGAERFYGTVKNLSGERFNYHWSIACVDKETPDCIEGTNVSELHVLDDTDGKKIMEFENGRWIVEPKGDIERSIRNELISDYGTVYPRVIDTAAIAISGEAVRETIDQEKSAERPLTIEERKARAAQTYAAQAAQDAAYENEHDREM